MKLGFLVRTLKLGGRVIGTPDAAGLVVLVRRDDRTAV